MSKSENNPTFVGLHGFAQGPWNYDSIGPEFENQGFDFIAPDLLLGKPEATFDDSARIVANAVAGIRRCVFLASSRSGNVAPRVIDLLEEGVEAQIIYVAASFVEETIGRPTEAEKEIMPPKNNPKYTQSIIRIDEHMAKYDGKLAAPLLLSDKISEPEFISDAISRFRPQRRFGKETKLQRWPSEVPMEYVVCLQDDVIYREWQEYVALNWIKTEPTYLDSGHLAPLTEPEKLSRIAMSKMAARFKLPDFTFE